MRTLKKRKTENSTGVASVLSPHSLPTPPPCPASPSPAPPDPAGARPHGPSAGGEPRLRAAAQRRQQHGLLLPRRRLPLAPPLLVRLLRRLGRRRIHRAPHAERRRAGRRGEAGAGHGLAERRGRRRRRRRRGRRLRRRPPPAAALLEVRSRPSGARKQRRLPARPHREISLPCGIFCFRISSSSLPEAAPLLNNRMFRTAAFSLLVQIGQTEVKF
jgi:hypothetical protein